MTIRPPSAVLGILLVGTALLPGCGDDATSSTTATTTAATTATTAETAGPPCFGLAEATTTPDWFGGLAFGVSHSLTNGGLVDLTGKTGCAIDAGILEVDLDGDPAWFVRAFLDDCTAFTEDDIPVADLRPAPDQQWICVSPSPDGIMYTVMNLGG